MIHDSSGDSQMAIAFYKLMLRKKQKWKKTILIVFWN